MLQWESCLKGQTAEAFAHLSRRLIRLHAGSCPLQGAIEQMVLGQQ